MDRYVVREIKNTTEKDKKQKNDSEGPIVSKAPSMKMDEIQNKIQNFHKSAEDQHKSKPASFERWKKTFDWLLYKNEKVFCSLCTEIVSKKCPLFENKKCETSRKAFVESGFSCWKNAVQSFKNHECSELHTAAIQLKLSNNSNIIDHLSDAKKKEMLNARVALHKIFTTIGFLSRQGLSFRRENDEESNFYRLLKLRSDDSLELQTWLNRKGSNYTWLHHTFINEILTIMADHIRQEILEEIKLAPYFSIMIDETSDIKRLEQISLCFRTVREDLIINEYFLGFRETKSTKAATLLEIVQESLKNFGLSIFNLRGQCYDGARNVSGQITGLQARIREIEPRALHVHCLAHISLNLVVQDAMEDLTFVKNFIGIIKELLNFIRDSPKRLSQFKDLQAENSPSLTPFCPTRWTMRISSLKRLHENDNYNSLLEFFDNKSTDHEVDAVVCAKSRSFLQYLQSFEFYFLLTTITEIFEQIENLNTKLQKSELCLNNSSRLVKIVFESLEVQRDSKFESIWKNVNEGVEVLNLEEPRVPRQRKISKRVCDSNNEAYIFRDPEIYYRKLYFEIYDKVLMALRTRFDTSTINLLCRFENFLVGMNDDVAEIVDFYNKSTEESVSLDHFDCKILLSQRDLFLSYAKKMNIP